ncbi:MAG: hypothetical protein ACKO0M_00680 [Cyanobium sp.]
MAIPIAARGCGDETLAAHADHLAQRLAEGRPFAEALEADQPYWGRRSVAVIRRRQQSDLAGAFRRLAAGAGEHPLQRPVVACSDRSIGRALWGSAVLLVLAAACLPVLPHGREGHGRIRVLGMAEGTIADPYALLSTHDPLRWSAELRRALAMEVVRPGSQNALSCPQSAALNLRLVARELDLERALTSLQPSPVPIIWAERWLVVEGLLRPMSTTGQLEMGRWAVDRLVRRCPELG